MKVLVTGASGFIGSHLVSKLLSNGHIVTAMCRQIPKQYRHQNVERIQFIEANVSSFKSSIAIDIDLIIHLAAVGVSPRIATWYELENVNITGTLNMCKIAQKLGAPIIISGSYAEYGNSALKYRKIPADAPLEPTFPYAVSKASACQLALGFARSEGTKLAYLRIFNAFGEGQYYKNLWPSLKTSACTGRDFQITLGEQIRDFISIEDVTSRITYIAESKLLKPHSPYIENVASGTPQTIRSFCENWWTIFKAKGQLQIGKIPYRENEVMRYVPCLKPCYL